MGRAAVGPSKPAVRGWPAVGSRNRIYEEGHGTGLGIFFAGYGRYVTTQQDKARRWRVFVVKCYYYATTQDATSRSESSDRTQERNNYRHNETGTPRGGKKPARDRGAPDGRDSRLDGRVRRRRGRSGVLLTEQFLRRSGSEGRRRANLHHHLTVPSMSATMVKKR